MIPHVDGKNFQNQIFDRSEIFSRIFPDLIENLFKKNLKIFEFWGKILSFSVNYKNRNISIIILWV